MTILLTQLLVPWAVMLPFVLVLIATADMLAGEWCPARCADEPDEMFVAFDPATDGAVPLLFAWNPETGTRLVEPSKLG